MLTKQLKNMVRVFLAPQQGWGICLWEMLLLSVSFGLLFVFVSCRSRFVFAVSLNNLFIRPPAFAYGRPTNHIIRWATLMAHRLLSSHEPELKSVMKAFREGKPVSECVAALEGARS